MSKQPSIGDMMAAYAEDAVDHARSASGATLDYSSESIRKVEDVLAILYAVLPKSFFGRLFGRGPSAEDVSTMSKMYGGYIGEVLRRMGRGEWVLDPEIVPGQQTISLRKGEARIFPPAKVQKRLTNGADDNVWVYLQVLSKDWW